MFGRLFSAGVILAGLLLIGSGLFGGGLPGGLSSGSLGFGDEPPEGASMSLTIPKMDRVEDTPVYTAPSGADEEALAAGASHLAESGYPWQEGANVYVSGHRMGYPGTDSFLVFYDLDELEAGDEVYLTDAEGYEYRYVVYEKFVVGPSEMWVTDPVPGANVLTLQTCTLPDYSQRLVVRAELQPVW